MGNNLKGRECGKGICQRKDGKYSACYIARDGSRREKHFDTPNTRRNYRERYVQNIQLVIGSMLISDVKLMHCKVILNRMEAEYAGSTIRQTYIAMGTMLQVAVNNDIISRHPMDGVLEYVDRRKGETKCLVMRDLVFVNLCYP